MTKCSISTCNQSAIARGFCSRHWQRWRKHGHPEVSGRASVNGKLFIEKSLNELTDSCIIWPYNKDGNGYARGTIDGIERQISPYVCEKAHGLPPAPWPVYQAAHSCGQGHQGCINHRHLRWATAKENMDDQLIHGTRVYGEKHKHAKLTEADVIEIRRLRPGVPLKELATRYGVAISAISRIANGVRWGHIIGGTP